MFDVTFIADYISKQAENAKLKAENAALKGQINASQAATQASQQCATYFSGFRYVKPLLNAQQQQQRAAYCEQDSLTSYGLAQRQFTAKPVPPMSMYSKVAATTNTPPPVRNTYNLNLSGLSLREASALVAVCTRVTGPAVGPRGLFDEIRKSLNDQGVNSTGQEISDLNSLHIPASTRD